MLLCISILCGLGATALIFSIFKSWIPSIITFIVVTIISDLLFCALSDKISRPPKQKIGNIIPKNNKLGKKLSKEKRKGEKKKKYHLPS